MSNNNNGNKKQNNNGMNSKAEEQEEWNDRGSLRRCLENNRVDLGEEWYAKGQLALKTDYSEAGWLKEWMLKRYLPKELCRHIGGFLYGENKNIIMFKVPIPKYAFMEALKEIWSCGGRRYFYRENPNITNMSWLRGRILHNQHGLINQHRWRKFRTKYEPMSYFITRKADPHAHKFYMLKTMKLLHELCGIHGGNLQVWAKKIR
mgnify:CR=1 FL=1